MGKRDKALKARMLTGLDEIVDRVPKKVVHTVSGMVLIRFRDGAYILLQGECDRDGYTHIKTTTYLGDVFANDWVCAGILSQEEAEAWAEERRREDARARIERDRAQYEALRARFERSEG